MKKHLLAVVMTAALMSISCLASTSGLSETKEAVAKIQIQELLYRYALTHNTDDPEGYANLFTADGEFGPVKGRDAIRVMAVNEVKKLGSGATSVEGEYHFGFMRSLIINPVIDIIDATHAKGISYLQVVVPNVDNNNVPTILFMGTYQDEYRKVDGKWLIAKRKSFGNMSYPGLGKKLGLGG